MGDSGFHLISLPLGTEDEMLDGALAALLDVDAGETAFLPEFLAWTPHGSGRAFARLVSFAQEQDINIVTTLNLGGDLLEDLPGHDAEERYNALTIFTRHGVVHAPQAKCSPQSFEMDRRFKGPGIGVSPYARINKVQLDLDGAVFLICSDVLALQRFSPVELECDLMVVLGNFAYGAERCASRLLGRALESRAASTAVHVNAFHVSRDPRRPSLAVRVEEVLDATSRGRAAKKWASPRAMRAAFYVYPDRRARDFVAMCNLPRRGRIAVPESRWEAPLTIARYPVTVVF